MYTKSTHWNLLFIVDLLYYIFVHMYLYYVRARKFLVCVLYLIICVLMCVPKVWYMSCTLHVCAHVVRTHVPHIYMWPYIIYIYEA